MVDDVAIDLMPWTQVIDERVAGVGEKFDGVEILKIMTA